MRMFLVLALLLLVLLPSAQARGSQCFGRGCGVNVWAEYQYDHGLTDSQGNSIVPATYASIEYLGHGVFLARNHTPINGATIPPGAVVLNGTGKKLQVEVPEGTYLQKVLWLGKDCSVHRDCRLIGELPEDTLLMFDRQGYGVCNRFGDIILPPIYSWIGYAGEGKILLQRDHNETYLFDASTQNQQLIACPNPQNALSIHFNEGLSPVQIGNLFGYMDTAGRLVILPRFSGAGGFIHGRASVVIPNSERKVGRSVLIDRTGKIISPPSLSVIHLAGDYVIVSTRSGRGVVNRDFNFVIKPEYQDLLAQWTPGFNEDDAWALNSREPMFYFARKTSKDPVEILSATGERLFNLPEGAIFPISGYSYFQGGAIRCSIGGYGPDSRIIYTNMHGEEVPPPYTSLAHWPNESFREIAPGILLKTLKPTAAQAK